MEVALKVGSDNSKTCQKIERDSKASHTILEAHARGEMPKEEQNPEWDKGIE